MQSSKLIAIGIAILAVVWVGSSFLTGGGAAEEGAVPAAVSAATDDAASREKPVPVVRVREIEPETYSDMVQVTGRSQASKTVALKAEIAGQLVTLDKEEGAKVAEGDRLASLEVLDRAARAAEAKQRVNQRQIEYNAAKKLEDKGFNSRVRLAQALADLEDAKARLKDAQVALGKIDITAPFDGLIYQQDVEIGDYLSVGDTMFTLVDLDPVEFVGYVSERHVLEIKPGAEAEAEFLDGRKIKGVISYVAPASDPQTRTFRIIMSAENPDNAIKEGLTAKLYIPVSDRKAYKISPAILSLNDAGQIGVKIVDAADQVQFVPVKILSDKPKAMWITGPEGKTKFITVGQDFVIEGQKVKPVESDKDGLL